MKLLKKFLKSSYEIKILIITVIIFTFFILGTTIYAYWYLNHQTNVEMNLSDKCILMPE
jgi:hypothetical protein